MAVIETVDLTKRYATVPVLNGLNLCVEQGKVYGLLGPNGAGKSTLIHVLMGFLRPDSGRISVLGTTPAAARSRLGYLPERVQYHVFCSAREYLHDLATFSNLRGQVRADRCRAMLQLVGLAPVADRPIGTFSKGMLQRLGIAQALLHDPDLLLIDEPTSGLDPAGQRELLDLLMELRRQGRTILLCSHQLADVEVLCDQVGILRGGRLAAQVRVGALSAENVTIITAGPALPAAAMLALNALGPSVEIAGLAVRVSGDPVIQQRALRCLIDAGVSIVEVRSAGSGLMDLYLRVTHDQPLPASVTAPGAEHGGESAYGERGW